MIACSIATRSHLAHARVLSASFLEHHPGSSFVLLVVDGDPGEAPGGFRDGVRFVVPAELGVDPSELATQRAIYSAKELSCALKPAALEAARADDADGVALFLDSDIEVHAPLERLGELALEHDVVLSPHMTAPLPTDGLEPDDLGILTAGTFNGGVLAVGPGGDAFLSWWSRHLQRDAIEDPAAGLVLDQRWLSLVPALFRHAVCTDPGVNVAYWNLHERRVEIGPGGPTVDGGPLRSFHYSGFSPAQPAALTSWAAEHPRWRLGHVPALAVLCRQYARRLREAGWTPIAPPWRYGCSADGVELTIEVRRRWRRELLDAERLGAPRPPDPFARGSGFDVWARR